MSFSETNELKSMIEKALEKLYEDDRSLIKRRVDERAIVFRFGIYIQNLILESAKFKDYDVDVEYNKNGDNMKIINNKRNGVRPDLIIHKRESNQANILILEFKKSRNGRLVDRENDYYKLKEFTKKDGIYKYSLGAFIEIGEKVPEIRYFSEGKIDE